MPLSIRLSADLIDNLNDAIMSGMRGRVDRGVEVGGILMGRLVQSGGQKPAVFVERCEPLASEYRQGPSFVLSDRDKRALGRRLDHLLSHPKDNLRPVGYFRSHTRRGLYLDNHDFSIIEQFFPERYAVFLLVRPAAGAPGTAGFFFWENGDIHRESSYQEFPFDRAAALPVTAPEREETPVAVGAHEVQVARPLPPLRSTAVNPPATALEPRGDPEGPAPEEQEPWLPVRKQLPAIPGLGGAWLKTAVPAALALVVILAFYEAHRIVDGWSQSPAETAATQPAPTPAASRPAPPVALPGATQPESLATPPPRLSAPEADRVAVPSDSKPSPLVRAPKSVQAAASRGAETAEQERTAVPQPVVPHPKPAPPAATAPVTAHANTSPPSQPTVVGAAPAAHPAASPAPPPVVAESTPPPVVTPVARPTVPARLSAPVASVTFEPAPEGRLHRFVDKIPGFRRRDKRSAYVPARPVREITPAVPPSLAGRLNLEVPVSLKVTVDKSGAVTSVENASRSADKRLVRLAEDAAHRWQFEPARDNDETVSSAMILHFTFRNPEP